MAKSDTAILRPVSVITDFKWTSLERALSRA
jgi:hypothetical protein